MITDEQLNEINKATAEWTMMAARGECGWICADCCAFYADGMPDECFHGHQRCTDIIKRDKIEALEQKTGMLPLELTSESGGVEHGCGPLSMASINKPSTKHDDQPICPHCGTVMAPTLAIQLRNEQQTLCGSCNSTLLVKRHTTISYTTKAINVSIK